MLLNKYVALCILFIFFVSQNKNYAAEYTLEQAANIAIDNNPEVTISKKEIESAIANKLLQTSISDLEFEAELSGIPPNFATTEETKLGLSQMFEFPGNRKLKTQISDIEIQIAKLNYEKTKLLVGTETKKAYYKVLLNQKIVSGIESTIDSLKQFLETTNVKYKNLSTNYLDVIRAKVELVKVKNELIEAENELSIEKRNLNLLLDRNPDEQLVLTSEMVKLPINKIKDELIKEVTIKSNTLQIAKLFVEKHKKTLALSHRNYLPEYSVGIFTRGLKDSNSVMDIGFKTSLPIYYQFKQTGEIKESTTQLQLAQTKLAALKKNIIRNAENVFESLKSAEKQLYNFEQTLLYEIEDELKSGINSYQTGQIESLNLIEIYRTYKTAKTDYLKTLYNYLILLTELQTAGEVKE